MELDHLAVAGSVLAEATGYVENQLGVSLQSGGEHPVYGTHNTLLGLLDGLYLEAIAVNPAAEPQRRPRWFDLDRFKGPARLTNWICRCGDLDATLAALPDGFGTPIALTRGDLRWRMAVPADGVLPFDNCAPALIQWDGDLHPARVLETATVRMTRFSVRHPDAAALQAMLKPFLTDARIQFEEGAPGFEARFDHEGAQKVLR